MRDIWDNVTKKVSQIPASLGRIVRAGLETVSFYYSFLPKLRDTEYREIEAVSEWLAATAGMWLSLLKNGSPWVSLLWGSAVTRRIRDKVFISSWRRAYIWSAWNSYPHVSGTLYYCKGIYVLLLQLLSIQTNRVWRLSLGEDDAKYKMRGGESSVFLEDIFLSEASSSFTNALMRKVWELKKEPKDCAL